MYAIAEEAEDVEQAGSVEQPLAAPSKRRRMQRAARGSSLQAMPAQGTYTALQHDTQHIRSCVLFASVSLVCSSHTCLNSDLPRA